MPLLSQSLLHLYKSPLTLLADPAVLVPDEGSASLALSEDGMAKPLSTVGEVPDRPSPRVGSQKHF